ncbi:EGF-like module-containing mucin-like hormone receptor-like 3 [Platysternon megacephalum]|uniref:EGF-like module-containing mucin-like hormone receptor-like 3 n=1 Tax=Platysternon megacephalum TaxID=55544 RepID=A0A4D9DN10_9SAUR|nr:EGF-like module-containing mucin-like hormone receptor-like 3 [Platysternon megacephalum]
MAQQGPLPCSPRLGSLGSSPRAWACRAKPGGDLCCKVGGPAMVPHSGKLEPPTLQGRFLVLELQLRVVAWCNEGPVWPQPQPGEGGPGSAQWSPLSLWPLPVPAREPHGPQLHPKAKRPGPFTPRTVLHAVGGEGGKAKAPLCMWERTWAERRWGGGAHKCSQLW